MERRPQGGGRSERRGARHRGAAAAGETPPNLPSGPSSDLRLISPGLLPPAQEGERAEATGARARRARTVARSTTSWLLQEERETSEKAEEEEDLDELEPVGQVAADLHDLHGSNNHNVQYDRDLRV